MSDESDLARRSQQAPELAQHEAVGRGGARVIEGHLGGAARVPGRVKQGDLR